MLQQCKYDSVLIIYINNNMIIRKVAGLWIVERKHSGQIIFSHKSRMTCHEWIFNKYVHYA